MLHRPTHLFALSYLRKITSGASLDASNNKIVHMRLASGQTYGYLCVTGDTQILLGDGKTTKAIKDLDDSDTVMTINVKNYNFEPSKIKNFYTQECQQLYIIKCRNG